MSIDTNFNLKFDANAGLDAVKEQAVNTVKTAATDSIMSLLMGDCDTANSKKRGVQTAADKAKSAAEFEQQRAVCSAALNSLIQLAQTGELDLTQFQSLLKDTVIQSIKDNNAKGITVKESIQNIKDENDKLKEEISALNGGSLEGIELEEISNDTVPAPTKEGEAPKEKKSKSKKVEINNPNAEKIQALIDRYNNNIGILSGLQVQLVTIAQEQTQSIAEGDSIKEQAQTKQQDVQTNLQESGRNFFQQIGDSIRKIFSGGKSKQMGHKVANTTMTATDNTAGTVATAKAAAAAGKSVVTMGASSAEAAEWTKKAAMSFASAAVSTGNSVLSTANITALAAGQQTVGNLVAQQIESTVNEKVSGAITEVTTQIVGEDVAQYVAPELADLAKIDMGEAPQQA